MSPQTVTPGQSDTYRAPGPLSASPYVGATDFGTGDIYSHSEYFNEGAESLPNPKRIVTGDPDEVTTD